MTDIELHLVYAVIPMILFVGLVNWATPYMTRQLGTKKMADLSPDEHLETSQNCNSDQLAFLPSIINAIM